MPHPQQQKLLSVSALCERYGVSRSTLYGWLKIGLLPQPIRLTARCVRWRPEDLAQFEANSETQQGK